MKTFNKQQINSGRFINALDDFTDRDRAIYKFRSLREQSMIRKAYERIDEDDRRDLRVLYKHILIAATLLVAFILLVKSI